jgi:hypothetical protein
VPSLSPSLCYLAFQRTDQALSRMIDAISKAHLGLNAAICNTFLHNPLMLFRVFWAHIRVADNEATYRDAFRNDLYFMLRSGYYFSSGRLY